MLQNTGTIFDEKKVIYLHSNEESFSLLIEYIEDPRGSILGPLNSYSLTTDHPKEPCPLCNFAENHAQQLIDCIQVTEDFPCLLTTVTRQYAPHHQMVLSINPHPQYLFSVNSLEILLKVLESSGETSQIWFNSKGAGAGIYTHFHFHLSSLHAPIWSWIDSHFSASPGSLKHNLVTISEMKGWPARIRLYTVSDKAYLLSRITKDLQDLHKNNVPYTLFLRLTDRGAFQAIVCPRIWSDPHNPTVLLFPHEGPYLWYPRLGAPGVPGGAIYVVGEQTRLTSRQKSIIRKRIKHEMYKLSDWSWNPEKQI